MRELIYVILSIICLPLYLVGYVVGILFRPIAGGFPDGFNLLAQMEIKRINSIYDKRQKRKEKVDESEDEPENGLIVYSAEELIGELDRIKDTQEGGDV